MQLKTIHNHNADNNTINNSNATKFLLPKAPWPPTAKGFPEVERV